MLVAIYCLLKLPLFFHQQRSKMGHKHVDDSGTISKGVAQKRVVLSSLSSPIALLLSSTSRW